MKIIRNVNGQEMEFELTNDELYSAYLEKEHEYDCQDIQDELENYNYSDDTRNDFLNDYGVPFDKVFGNDELISVLAFEKRHNIDHFGMEWTSARDNAFVEVLAKRRLELIGLPEVCYSTLPSTGELIILSRGQSGYIPCSDFTSSDCEKNRKLAAEHNAEMGLTKAQVSAMEAGSMFGWDVPAADPKNYDESGRPIPASHERSEAR